MFALRRSPARLLLASTSYALLGCDQPENSHTIQASENKVAATVHELAWKDHGPAPEEGKEPWAETPEEPPKEPWEDPKGEANPQWYPTITVTGSPENADARIAERIGWGRLNVNGVQAFGTRPLMVLMLDFSDRSFAPGFKTSDVEAMFFGPSLPNVVAWTEEASNGAFSWTPAGVYRLTSHDMPNTAGDESRWECVVAERCGIGGYGSGELLRVQAVRAAVRAGVDFRPFDVNGDGRVTQDELQIHVFEAWNDATARGGANRGVSDRNCVGLADGSKVDVCPGRVGSGTEASPMDVHIHELVHGLGVEDVYNIGCDSFGLTLMSCMGRLVMLDPWHRIQLGWAFPRHFPFDGAGNCQQLASIDMRGDARNEPILLGDVDGRDFFLFERRVASAFDRDLMHGNGVAVWQLRARPDAGLELVGGEVLAPGPNGVIDTVAANDDWTANGPGNRPHLYGGANRRVDGVVAGDDVRVPVKAMRSFGAAGGWESAGTAGGERPWQYAHGAAELRDGDGMATGIWFRAGPDTGGRYQSVAWGWAGDASAAYPPRFEDPARVAGECLDGWN